MTAARGRSGGVLRRALRSVEGRVAVTLAVIMTALIALGPLLAPYPPDQIGVAAPFSRPSMAHLLGADELGRDVLSRFLHGGTEILLIPLASITIAAVLGGLVGIMAAFRGGWLDRLALAVFDIMLTLPTLLVVLVVVALLGGSAPVLIACVAVTYAPSIGKVVRGSARGIVGEDYVDAAVARGESTPAIAIREVLPGIVGPVLADLALRVTYAIGFVATLNFLGLGAQPPSRRSSGSQR